ncbi:hypothetical protein, partial [Rhodanobacter terrae]
AFELFGHVLLVQRLDRLPVESKLLGDIADRCTSTAPSDVPGKLNRPGFFGGMRILYSSDRKNMHVDKALVCHVTMACINETYANGCVTA